MKLFAAHSQAVEPAHYTHNNPFKDNAIHGFWHMIVEFPRTRCESRLGFIGSIWKVKVSKSRAFGQAIKRQVSTASGMNVGWQADIVLC